MAGQYGTKAWAKWAKQNLEIALSLLKEPNKEWDQGETHLQVAIRILNVIKKELENDNERLSVP